MSQEVKQWNWYYKNFNSWYAELVTYVADGHCDDSGTPVNLSSDFIPPTKF